MTGKVRGSNSKGSRGGRGHYISAASCHAQDKREENPTETPFVTHNSYCPELVALSLVIKATLQADEDYGNVSLHSRSSATSLRYSFYSAGVWQILKKVEENLQKPSF
jgi:hypothetical protein